jgi:hypothetical protein
MPFTEADWDTLLTRIGSKQCIPIIGAGASVPRLPLGKQLASDLSKHIKDHQPPDGTSLEQVAQHIVIERKDSLFPKTKVTEILKDYLDKPYTKTTADPHTRLARLKLPIYITTNYDTLLEDAIRVEARPFVSEYCRWNNSLATAARSTLDDGKYAPAADKPLVFHMHGHLDHPESLVLSEDDYLDFTVNMSRDLVRASRRPILPFCLRRGFKNSTLLFIGYALTDIDFRILLRGLLGSIQPAERKMSLTVQYDPNKTGNAQAGQRLREYIEGYFGWSVSLQVCWGSAEDFLTELSERLASTSDAILA